MSEDMVSALDVLCMAGSAATPVVVILWRARRLPSPGGDIHLPEAPPGRGRRRWSTAGWAMLALGVIFWLGERISPSLLDGVVLGSWRLVGDKPTYLEQFGLWGAAVALFVVGVSPWADFVALARQVHESWRTGWPDWLLVAGCMVVTFALRTTWLETTIPVVFGDESSFSQQAAMVSAGYRAVIFAPARLSHPWVYSVAIAPFVGLMGRTLTAARMFSALCGTLTVPAVYLMAREMFDRWVAAVAAIFLTGWSLHLHFSRLAMNNIVDPLFGALAFAFLMRGLRRGDRLNYALAGVALGLSQYFYAGARLYPLVMVGYVTLLGLLRWRLVRRAWRGLVVLALAAMIVTWPANYYLWGHGLPLTSRAGDVSILVPRADHGGRSPLETMWASGAFVEYMGDQVYNALLAFNYKSDLSRYYGGHTALFLPVASMFFLLGVMWAIWHWKKPAVLLLLLLMAATVVFGGVLLFTPPHFTRYLVAVPAMVILFALGLVKLTAFLAPRWQGRGALALGLAGLLALGSVAYYFGVHVGEVRRDLAPRTWQIRDLVQRIAPLPSTTMVYILHGDEIDLHAEEVIYYLAPDRSVTYFPRRAMNWSFVYQLSPGEHVLFISPARLDDLRLLELVVPDGRLEPWPYVLPRGVPFLEYRVSVP